MKTMDNYINGIRTPESLRSESDSYVNILQRGMDGKAGRVYLKSRGLNKSTAEYWNLGYAPINYVPPNFNSDDLIKPWIKMWDRITFPILNNSGDVISIAGRLLNVTNVERKYDAYTFQNRNTLFGLYQNRENIIKSNYAILTEGQMDVISAWNYGLRNVVSSFGAHLSLNQLALLTRYTNQVYLLYDNDSAGIRGANEAVDKYKKLGINLIAVNGALPPNTDLDDWFKSGNDIKSLLERILNYDLYLITKRIESMNL